MYQFIYTQSESQGHYARVSALCWRGRGITSRYNRRALDSDWLCFVFSCSDMLLCSF